jgi:putative ATP-binding cassette transporter
MNSSDSVRPPLKFNQLRFNKQLWDQFIAIAQPFFYPIAPGSTWKFSGLLLLLLVMVIGITFFLTIALTLLGQWLFPDFFNNLAPGLVETVQHLIHSRTPYAAAGLLLLSGLGFRQQRRRLKGRYLPWLLLGVVLFLLFAVNGFNVAISYIFRFIDNALNQKDSQTFYQFLWVYGGIIVAAIPIIIGYDYIRRKLGLMWREWLTQSFLDRYFKHRAYYQLDSNSVGTEIDNPDQRITVDIKAFTDITLIFLLDILDSVLVLISFTAILYSISKVLTFGLVVYALVGSLFALFVGGRLIQINYNQLKLEADFRYGMVHIRDNAESIAFYRGEALECQQIFNRLMAAIQNYDLLIIWESLIGMFQRSYNYLARLPPYLVVAALYFSGQMDFGAIGQAYLSFFQILTALSVITNQIQQISAFGASINRLGNLDQKLNQPEPDLAPQVTFSQAPHLILTDLSLQTPNGEQALFEKLSLTLGDQAQLLVVGPSGCGKSSLLRAIAGLWNRGEGTIARPEPEKLLFLPQRPYLLLGNLRQQLVYPNPEASITDEAILAALAQVNLEHLPERLGGFGAQKDWPMVLSLGEQQRLAFARILLTQPQYVLLDEATSALDGANECNLYRCLQGLQLAYLSVGHRPSLLDYHQTVLELTPQLDWHLYTAEDYQLTLD